MRAVSYDRFGPPDVLELSERPKPVAGPGEVLVQVAATSVNPIDRRLRNGELQAFFQRSFPIIPGWDVAGRIVEVGPDVTGWTVGDDVVALAFTWQLHHGSYAEYIPVQAISIARKPAGLSFHQAAALPLVSLTAWQALTEIAQVQHGQRVFVSAGAGGVGSVAISMAHHLGARVYTTTRQANAAYVQARGADISIDYATGDYMDMLTRMEAEGFDAVLELLSDLHTVQNAIRLCKTGGAVVYMNNEPPAMPEIKERNIRTEWIHHRADGKMLGALMALYANGSLMLPDIEVLPLECAAEAHRRSESNRTRGKLVLHVQDVT